MIPCTLIRKPINKDKELIIIKSVMEDIYVISSKKWNTAYIHPNKQECFLLKSGVRYDLICFDKMGFKTTYEKIDRFVFGKFKFKIKKYLIDNN
jgi:hypothetical protein